MSHSFEGLVASPPNLQAMPTMATGTLRWKGLPSPLLLALPAAPVSSWRIFAVCKPFDIVIVIVF